MIAEGKPTHPKFIERIPGREKTLNLLNYRALSGRKVFRPDFITGIKLRNVIPAQAGIQF
jgi:hypothetical protein